MKVYVIYDTENQEHPEISGGAPGPFGKKCLMVGFTNSEKLAEKYIQHRKKKVFKLKTYKMDKKDYVRLCNSYALREIQEFKLTTRVDGTHTSSREVKLPLTPSEYNIVSEANATYGCQHIAFYPVDIFDRKYGLALLKLEYSTIAAVNEGMVSTDGQFDECVLCDGLPDASMDEVAVYVANNFDDFK